VATIRAGGCSIDGDRRRRRPGHFHVGIILQQDSVATRGLASDRDRRRVTHRAHRRIVGKHAVRTSFRAGGRAHDRDRSASARRR